jgi:hypothetical protein
LLLFNGAEEKHMTLQPENGAPSFYTFPTFRPARKALLYGGLLSIFAFCAVTFIFNYGIKEKLWSYEMVQPGLVSPGPVESAQGSASAAISAETLRRIALSDHVLHSLEGTYFSEAVNRTYNVSLNGRRLYLQIDHQEKIELIPVSGDTLYAGEGHVIKFAPGVTGSVEHVDVYDNGSHIVAVRR